MSISKKNRILVTGSAGFLGGHVVSELEERGYSNLWLPGIEELDLLDIKKCKEAVSNVDVVVNLAAKVGGTMENVDYPADYFYENVMTGMNLIHASRNSDLKKFVQLGTVISYPVDMGGDAVSEEMLWRGYPDDSKEGYAMAKKVLLVAGRVYRKQYKIPVVHLLLANMYGPGDHFRSSNTHVVPALIDRFWDAKEQGKAEEVVWGSGKATRDFLYVGDAARAIVDAMDKYDSAEPVNIASGFEVPISELAESIAKHVGFEGKIVWDASKPDGQLRSSYSVKRASDEFSWEPEVSIDEGIKRTIGWYKENVVNVI